MLTFKGKRVYLAAGATDMRKQINGLASLVEAAFNLCSADAAVFVFCNRQRNRLKILEWDRDGFWLYFKRLEKGHFSWPGATKEYETVTLSPEELKTLLSSTAIARIFKRDTVINRGSV
jgi:transposase